MMMSVTRHPGEFQRVYMYLYVDLYCLSCFKIKMINLKKWEKLEFVTKKVQLKLPSAKFSKEKKKKQWSNSKCQLIFLIFMKL